MLKTPVTIERRTRSSDGYGGVTEVWSALNTTPLWARVRVLTGTESWEASRVTPGNLLEAIIRFRGDSLGAPYYTASDRMIIRGREYAILSVTDMNMEQEWLRFYIHESRPS